jgi:hypothetical protein
MLYTTQRLTTHNGFQWKVGKKVTTSREGGLCDPGYLHYYHHPLLAVLLNSAHTNFQNPILWKVEVADKQSSDISFQGSRTEMTLLEEIDLPIITGTQRIVFGILCAKEVTEDKKWNKWADDWLSNKDRTKAVAIAAARDAAWVYCATEYAAYGDDDDVASAGAVTWAAVDAACTADANLDLIKIAKKSLKY